MSRVIEANGKKHTLEFTFEAASHKLLLTKMFNIMSGATLVKYADGDNEILGMIQGMTDMATDIPEICKLAFYAGSLENNPVTEAASKKILKDYMIENDLGFDDVFAQIKEWMEEDGFFKLSGIQKMLEQMTEETPQEPAKTTTKKTTKKSSTT